MGRRAYERTSVARAWTAARLWPPCWGRHGAAQGRHICAGAYRHVVHCTDVRVARCPHELLADAKVADFHLAADRVVFRIAHAKNKKGPRAAQPRLTSALRLTRTLEGLMSRWMVLSCVWRKLRPRRILAATCLVTSSGTSTLTAGQASGWGGGGKKGVNIEGVRKRRWAPLCSSVHTQTHGR